MAATDIVQLKLSPEDGDNHSVESAIASIQAARQSAMLRILVASAAPPRALFNEIGRIPLVEFRLWGCSVPATWMAQLFIQTAGTLKSLEFSGEYSRRCRFLGDIAGLCEALNGHASLENFNMYIDSPTVVDRGQNFWLLIHSLASCPNLQRVKLKNWRAFGGALRGLRGNSFWVAMYVLVQSRSLQELRVQDFQEMAGDPRLLFDIFLSLKTNSSLKKLELGGFIAWLPHCTPQGEKIIDFIAEMLRANSTLQELEAWISTAWTEQHLLPIVEALNVNRSLKKLRLGACGGPRDCNTMAWAGMLESNCVLEELGILFCSSRSLCD